MDQGSVLAVRVFGSLSIYFTPQPEVVPVNSLEFPPPIAIGVLTISYIILDNP